ncbi:hypothetical protein NHX12_004244 [Muraenolepis orangiensis]|uniref:G-protein coupled receptors family 1 profile domain-containing protein n=1 Tax=Muraenolepis orangiensis TaxID=630683 RepID=A0A9Q0IDN9_9TELE|nr:hypothetical protein NHX12_004244 [Muraenolepis orangiensis]
MNSTTPFYDVYYSLNTEDYDAVPVHVCERKNENHLGSQLSVFYFLMFVLSLIGNGLVLVIIYRFEKWTTVTNIFLLNLVVSDLILMCSLPFWGVYQQLSTWIFGASMCKIVGSAYFLGFYSSILFLTLLTFDQHLAVVYSLVAPRLRRQNYAIACCTGVWLLSCLACVKPIILYRVFTDFNNKQFCEEYPSDFVVNTFVNVSVLKDVWIYLQLCFFFVFPLAVIVYCYIRVGITVVSSRITAKFRTMQCKPLQPLNSHSLSTSAPNHSEAGELVYTGSLTKSIIGVKLFSYTSSGTSLFLMPYVLFQSSLATQNLALQASFITVISLFTFATPVLLHLLTTGYVTQLYHHAEQDSYTAVTYNFFLMKRRTVFKQAEVRVPDVTGMFTTFYAGRKGLLVNPDLFQLPSDYNHLMGYDRPFTFSEEDMERPDKV